MPNGANVPLVCEVYERCVYDNVSHFHFASLPGMFERTMTLFSVGKTFSCTGWRVGCSSE